MSTPRIVEGHSGSGSGMFYIRGRPSTAIGCGTSAIAFCQSVVIAVPVGTSLTWHSVVSLISGQNPSQWCLRLVVRNSGWAGTPTTTAMQHLLLHYMMTATVTEHTDQNQGHAWHDLGAQTRLPNVQRSGKDKHHMVREVKRQPNRTAKHRVSSPAGFRPWHAQKLHMYHTHHDLTTGKRANLT
jgi:hypothetical protein